MSGRRNGDVRPGRWERLRWAATLGPGALAGPATDPDASLPPILLLADVVRLFRCSRSTIERRIADGTFPVPPLASIDFRLRWSRDRLLDWINGTPPRLPLHRRPPRAGRRPSW